MQDVRYQGCLRFGGPPGSLEGTTCNRSSTISDPADPGLAYGHSVKSSSWEKAVEGILHFIGCAAGMGTFAPALFCLAIDWIMSRCSGSLGVTLGEAVFTDLDYADDAVLFAQDPGRWQAELKRFDDAATTMGLHTSWEKRKLQNIGYGHWSSTSTSLH